jgi:hypothetical protein
MTYRRGLVLPAVWFAFSTAAIAQSPLPPDPVPTGSLTIGPVALTPRVELRDVGVDSNVFNESGTPREDFTATGRFLLDAGLRLGVARVVCRSWLDVVYFQKYSDERSVNRFGEVRTEFRLGRFVPYVAVGGLDTTERPNNEIDRRADRATQTVSAGAALAVLPSTALVASVQRETVTYDPGQPYEGIDLAVQLNHRREGIEGGLRLALTALTTLLLTGAVEETRFDASPDRNSDSRRIGARFEFDPTALVSGTAAVGYRDFKPISASLERFRGIVAQVTARYAPGSRTLIGVQYRRDVEYSFEETQPYYVVNGGSLTVTQAVAGPFDVQVVASRDRLSYRGLIVAPGDGDVDSTQTTSAVAAGVGYRAGESTRFGVNVEFTERDGQQPDRSFERRRIFASMTHGF